VVHPISGTPPETAQICPTKTGRSCDSEQNTTPQGYSISGKRCMP
jgi:hypothetical protein